MALSFDDGGYKETGVGLSAKEKAARISRAAHA
jgi:hypothetical protein